MNKGSAEWLDTKILNELDRQWARRGKWCSVYDLIANFEGLPVSLDTLNERLYALYMHGDIQGMYAPNGKGPNSLYLLRYTRTRALY